ncbi:putative phosphoglycerate mutase [Glaciihabitans tibetensis]|uniref:Putative phosphoglycerate mutase n=1 Tax=Glaciihabitans tibetensis TaxID=1266600 RepID=A0A2T0V5M5_9MICO|nr:histidine phosphatase family protein [Glaciihabitans tibetensis]PRY65454.1 putative phosphoglycerate mutase [Glaciihabitans tibetensis]
MTTLLLVRHGPTDWTGEKRLQGRTDIDLSDSGRVSTVALAPIIAAWHPLTLIVSPLSRTRTTAAMLTGLEVIVDDRWAEAGLGEWEGRRADEIGADYVRWRAGTLLPPGAEATAAVTERVTAAVLSAATQPGPVLIVTHGGTIRSVLANFVGLTADRLEPVGAPSLTVLDVEAAGTARLRHYNLLA